MENLKLVVFILLGALAIFMALTNALGKWNKYNPLVFDIGKYLLTVLLGLIVYDYTNIFLGILTTVALILVIQLINKIGN
jgi:hypothetical protein